MTDTVPEISHRTYSAAVVEDKHVIIRYRTRAGEPKRWAECPSCGDVIDPESNDQ